MTSEVTTNDDQQLYVIPCFNAKGKVSGYTCLGYDVCIRWARLYAKWLRRMGLSSYYAPSASKRGTMEAYNRYRKLAARVSRMCREQNVRCGVQLTPQLIGKEGWRVELTRKSDGTTERFIVGRSMGEIPIHLASKRRDASGGLPVIVKPGDTIRLIEQILPSRQYNDTRLRYMTEQLDRKAG